MDRGASVAGTAWFLCGLGLTLASLATYWEGLPLGPRDGQAFLGAWLLGVLLALIAAIIGAVGLALAAGALGLVAAIGVGAGLGLFGLFVAHAPLALLLLPLTLVAGYSTRLGMRRFATVLGVAAAGVALMVGYLAFGGPNVWLTKGIDLAALLGAAILAVAVFLVAGRLARAEREPITGA
ncbi:MAG: hypothetical protein E6I51_05250 [Chloroflexi bacterium]|nr:MAG: hypothetical protein E6I51_05250 [Chloroflexota bacterium]